MVYIKTSNLSILQVLLIFKKITINGETFFTIQSFNRIEERGGSGEDMKRYMLLSIIVCLSLFSSSCSSNASQINQENMRIIDENLMLKEKMAELEMKLEQLQEEMIDTEMIQNQISNVFKCLVQKDFEQAKESFSEGVEITQQEIIFGNGTTFDHRIFHDQQVFLGKPIDCTIERKVGCVTYEVYNNKGVHYVTFLVQEQDNAWKISSITFAPTISPDMKKMRD